MWIFTHSLEKCCCMSQMLWALSRIVRQAKERLSDLNGSGGTKMKRTVSQRHRLVLFLIFGNINTHVIALCIGLNTGQKVRDPNWALFWMLSLDLWKLNGDSKVTIFSQPFKIDLSQYKCRMKRENSYFTQEYVFLV